MSPRGGQGEQGLSGRAEIQSPEARGPQRAQGRRIRPVWMVGEEDMQGEGCEGGGGGRQGIAMQRSDARLSMHFTVGLFRLGSNLISGILKAYHSDGSVESYYPPHFLLLLFVCLCSCCLGGCLAELPNPVLFFL